MTFRDDWSGGGGGQMEGVYSQAEKGGDESGTPWLRMEQNVNAGAENRVTGTGARK